MRPQRRRVSSRKIPQKPRAERTYVNEDVMPQPLRRDVNVDEIIIKSETRRAKAHPKVAHDYNPFGNQDRIAEPQRKAVFKPSKLQAPGYDAKTMKDRPDINLRRLGDKKVERAQTYVMRGEEMVQAVASRYYENTIDTYDEREALDHENVVDTFHRKTDNPLVLESNLDLDRSQFEQNRSVHSRDAQTPNEKGIQTFKVLTSYTVEVDRDGIEQNIYDARTNAREVSMDQAYASRTIKDSGLRPRDERENARPHGRDPSNVEVHISREVDGRIRIHDESQFNRGWDDYEKEQAQLWAEGPIWNAKTSSYEPQYYPAKSAYRDQNQDSNSRIYEARVGIENPADSQYYGAKSAYREQDLEVEKVYDARAGIENPADSQYYGAKDAYRERDLEVEKVYDARVRIENPGDAQYRRDKSAYRDQDLRTEIALDGAQAEVEDHLRGYQRDKNAYREESRVVQAQYEEARGEVENAESRLPQSKKNQKFRSRVAQPSLQVKPEEIVYDQKDVIRSRKAELSLAAQPEIPDGMREEAFDGRASVRTKKQERMAHRSARKEDPNQFAEKVEKSGMMPEDEFHDYMKAMNRTVEARAKHQGDINPINDWKKEIELERKSKSGHMEAARAPQTWSEKVRGEDRGAHFQERSAHGRNHGTDMVLTAGIVHDSYQEKLFGDKYYDQKEYRNRDNVNLYIPKKANQYVIPRDEQYYSEHERSLMPLEGIEAIRKDQYHEESIRELPSNVIKAHVNPRIEQRDAGVEPVRYDTSNVKSTDKIKKKVHDSKYSNRQESKKERHGRFKAKSK